MCGISGIINHKDAGSLISKMTEAQAHRGPDATGIYSSENIALGHNRLSIIDLSSNGNQPLYSTDKRYVIIFNGEVYNYAELKKLLKNNSYCMVISTNLIHSFKVKIRKYSFRINFKTIRLALV